MRFQKIVDVEKSLDVIVLQALIQKYESSLEPSVHRIVRCAAIVPGSVCQYIHCFPSKLFCLMFTNKETLPSDNKVCQMLGLSGSFTSISLSQFGVMRKRLLVDVNRGLQCCNFTD